MLSQLMKHLNSEHDCQITSQKCNFNNWLEFDTWKEEEEKQTRSYYVWDSSPKMYRSSIDLVTINPKGLTLPEDI